MLMAVRAYSTFHLHSLVETYLIAQSARQSAILVAMIREWMVAADDISSISGSYVVSL